MKRLNSWAGAIGMELLLSLAGGHWAAVPVRCVCGCGQTGQAVRQYGPRSCLLLGHTMPKAAGR